MKDRNIHGESNVWSTAQRQKISTDLMFMLGLKETIDQLTMSKSVHWYGHELWREDVHILRMALDLEVEGQRKKWKHERMWKMLDEVNKYYVFCVIFYFICQ